MYNIYNASVSPGSVQQIMLQTDSPYIVSGRPPLKTRITCCEECVFIGSLPSTGHGAEYIENIRYCCEVFSACCVATSAARTTKTPLLYCWPCVLFQRVCLATGIRGTIA
jgi:hypothetical protein